MGMLRTIRVMALLALGMHLILDVTLYRQIVTYSLTYSLMYYSPVGRYPYNPSSPLPSTLLYVLYLTTYLLAFALGVVTVVAAVQQRRRRWFIPLLPLTVLLGYLSAAPQISEDIISTIYVFSQPANPGQIQLQSTPPAFVVFIPLLILALPAALALTALAYTGRSHVWAAARTGAPSGRDDAEDQLEVNSIDLPLDGTR
jgi:hypothetical protein